MPKTTKRVKQKPQHLATKVVIVHKQALVGKYGRSGYAKIKAELDTMAKHDASRGVAMSIVLLDSKLSGEGVTEAKPSNAFKFKEAIDSIYTSKGEPEYLLLLGGPDVIPHVPLRNPWDGDSPYDEDAIVHSDLPYASNAKHALDARKFLDAPRAIGRIPDIPGSTSVSYLVSRIKEAAVSPAIKGRKHFALSTKTWESASTAIISQLFGASASLHCCPTGSPPWDLTKIKKPFQFINCHGAIRSPGFFGEPRNSAGELPNAIDTGALAKKVVPGAVVVSECCYGAELYQPRAKGPMQGMAHTYLEEGATTFLGSTTIAYGGLEAQDLGCADELCLEFFEGILSGVSSGQSLVAARRKMITNEPTLDNFQIKTLAQFILLGDPSHRPVPNAVPKSARKNIAAKSGAPVVNPTFSGHIRSTPVPKALGSITIADRAITLDGDRFGAAVPLPRGVVLSAKLFVPGAWGRASSGLARKSITSAETLFAEEESVLVVSIPDDANLIAEMRSQWNSAQNLEARQTTQRLAAKRVVRKSAPVLTLEQVGNIAAFASRALHLAERPRMAPRVPPFTIDSAGKVRFGGARAAKKAAPTKSETGDRVRPQKPEQTGRVAIVARLAKGRIRTYKVIVVR